MKGGDEVPLRNFAGLNVRDSADKIADNEFSSLQNVWQPTKGVFSRRFGSVSDLAAASFPLTSRVSGVWRHYAPNQQRFSIYHCVPDATLIPDNTSDLVLAELTAASGNTGNIFNGGAVADLYVCYSWIGCGMEQTYNSRNRAGFPAVGAFPINSWANPAHQKITLSLNTSSLQVTVPAFPTGVTGANIFVSRGVATQMVYQGTVTTSGGALVVFGFVGPVAAKNDTVILGTVTGFHSSIGKLKPGTYYIAGAPLCNTAIQEGAYSTERVTLTANTKVTLTGNQNAISVTGDGAATANGAYAMYIFLGTQDPKIHPMICMGIIDFVASIASGAAVTPASSVGIPPGGNYGSVYIYDFPAHNAQSSPDLGHTDTTNAVFWHGVNDGFTGGANYSIESKVQGRFGFLLKKRSDASTVSEIFPSRSLVWVMQAYKGATKFAGDAADTSATPILDLHNFVPNIRTPNDHYQAFTAKNQANAYTQPYTWERTPIDPTFAYQLGMSYMANGVDIPWVTDGYTLGQLGPTAAGSQTQLPPIPKYISVFQNSLVVSGPDNQLYVSNANAPQNWAAGGTGLLLRFLTIGDAVGSGITAQGVFTPQSDSPNNPGSYLIAFKKNGTWMANTIADPTVGTIGGLLSVGGGLASGITPLIQVSGHVGCVAYRSICQSPLGTIFLAQDGDVYLIRGVSQPIRIGTKIHNLLKHLVSSDSNMRLCTAVVHDHHYKLSFPSAALVAAAGSIYNDSELWADLRTDDNERIKWVGPHAGRSIGPQVIFSGDGDDFSRLCVDGNSVRTFTADGVSSLDDLGTGITYKILSKIFRFGKENYLKRILGALADCYFDESYTNNLLFEGFADADYHAVNKAISSGGATWDSSQWDQSNYADATWIGVSLNFGPGNLVGRTFQWRLSSSDKAPFVLASITLSLKTEKRRQSA